MIRLQINTDTRGFLSDCATVQRAEKWADSGPFFGCAGPFAKPACASAEYTDLMKKIMFLCVAVLLCGCGHATASPSPSATASALADHYTGVVTSVIPSTADGGVEITFLLPDGAYRTGSFSHAENVSVGDEVTVSGDEITVSSVGLSSFDEVTMPDLLATVEAAVAGFADNHTLGNANRAADFLSMDVSDIQNALVILPTDDDTTVLCYIITHKPEDAVSGFTDYTDAIKATYEDDPYAPSACDGACALVTNASITSGDHWALMIIAPDDQKAKLLDAVSDGQESGASGDD